MVCSDRKRSAPVHIHNICNVIEKCVGVPWLNGGPTASAGNYAKSRSRDRKGNYVKSRSRDKMS